MLKVSEEWEVAAALGGAGEGGGASVRWWCYSSWMMVVVLDGNGVSVRWWCYNSRIVVVQVLDGCGKRFRWWCRC